MRCPFCGAEDTKVINSRPTDDNASIRRRRQCETCGRRFTTFEKLEVFPIMIIKKDQSREPYSREKLRNGILLACHKRQVSADVINSLLDDIESALFNRYDREVPSSVIGEMVMERLRRIDEVAYVRFASVYRSFTDVNTFAEELKALLRKDGV